MARLVEIVEAIEVYRAKVAEIERHGLVDFGCVFDDRNGQGQFFSRYQPPGGGRRRYVSKERAPALRAACNRGREVRALKRQCIADIERVLGQVRSRPGNSL